MRVLIAGGTGLMGRAMVGLREGPDTVWSIYIGTYSMKDRENAFYRNADVCDLNSLTDCFSEAEPDVAVHAAGAASVDFCEKSYEEAWKSNVAGTANVIGQCREHGSKLIYISTNAVFNGRKAPYSESDIPEPINAYGRIKLECERLVKNSGLRHAIIRPILMYGWNDIHERQNPVTWIAEKLESGDRINMVNDVYENPLFNYSCAEAVWASIRKKAEGIYHVAGSDIVNRYEFAIHVADVFGLNKDMISAVTSDFFPGIAPRPRDTSYNTEKMERGLGVRPLGLDEGLLRMREACRHGGRTGEVLKCQR